MTDKGNFFTNAQQEQQEQMKKVEQEQHAPDEIVVFPLRMPAETRRQLRQNYAQTGESMNKFILRAIEKELEKL
jgi:predicted HicB family RNase H-like nuclease